MTEKTTSQRGLADIARDAGAAFMRFGKRFEDNQRLYLVDLSTSGYNMNFLCFVPSSETHDADYVLKTLAESIPNVDEMSTYQKEMFSFHARSPAVKEKITPIRRETLEGLITPNLAEQLGLNGHVFYYDAPLKN